MSQACSPRSCHGCCGSLDRRRFLQTLWSRGGGRGGGVAVAAVRRVPPSSPHPSPVRVAAVFLSSMNTNEIWPYPGFDTQGRQEEVLAALRRGVRTLSFNR